MEELDLKELFTIFWNRRLEIILITLIVAVIGIVYSYFFVVPEYKASTTLVLAQSSANLEQSGDGAITQTDLTLNSKLVATYRELMKSKAVLRRVVDSLKIEGLTEDSIRKNVFIEAITDTEVIEITVKNLDPNLAAQIANKIAEVFREKVIEIYNISNIYVLDRAEPSELPCNINHTKDIVIFMLMGFVASIIFVLMYSVLDTTIKTEQDVENITGLLVLSTIPNYDIEVKRKKGGRRV